MKAITAKIFPISSSFTLCSYKQLRANFDFTRCIKIHPSGARHDTYRNYLHPWPSVCRWNQSNFYLKWQNWAWERVVLCSLWNLSSCNLRVHLTVHLLFSGSLISSLEVFFIARNIWQPSSPLLQQPSHNYQELQMQGFTKSGKTHESDSLLIPCALRLKHLACIH